MRIARQTGLLLIIGTSGSTNLPQRIVSGVLSRHGMIIDINKNDNYFSELATKKEWLCAKGKQ
jgi:NAD-dependent deacetylase